MRPLAIAALALSLLWLHPPQARAHTQGKSYSTWTRQGQLTRVTFTVAALEATRLAALDDTDGSELPALLAKHVRAGVRLDVEGQPCSFIGDPTPISAPVGSLRVEASLRCPVAGPAHLRMNAFFDLAPSHIHYVQVMAGHERSEEHVLTDSRRETPLSFDAAPGSRREVLAQFVRLGIEHILTGWDHLCFLAALLLLCRRVREVALLVTGFTLGHSITLVLGATAFVQVNAPVIEALIGLTIAIGAADAALRRSDITPRSLITLGIVACACLGVGQLAGGGALPPLVLIGIALFLPGYFLLSQRSAGIGPLHLGMTVLFGLIHGFGFASVLREMDLPRGDFVTSLFGFNTGVEVGQLLVIATLALLARLLQPFTRALPSARALAAGVLCAFGLFWFVSRAAAVV